VIFRAGGDQGSPQFLGRATAVILRFAQNDSIDEVFRSTLWCGLTLKRSEAVFETLHFAFQSGHDIAGVREVSLLGAGFEARGYSNRLNGQQVSR